MDAAGAVPNGIGQAVQRKEDLRFLTGKGSYGDDLTLPGLAHAVLVRSPHAHARIRSIDKRAALAAPGVLAVLTGADYIADGLKPIPHNPGVVGAPDVVVRLRMTAPIPTCRLSHAGRQGALRRRGRGHGGGRHDRARQGRGRAGRDRLRGAAGGDARHRRAEAGRAAAVGRGAGQSLRRCRGRRRAGRPPPPSRAPPTWCGSRPGSSASPACRWRRAPRPATTTRRAGTTRSMPAPAAASRPSACSCPHILGVPPEKVRCACKDMGGNFGTRNFFFPEYALLPWAARKVGRPVKWTCERREAFLSDYQGRDLAVEAELALDKDGNFLAHSRRQFEQSRRPCRRLRVAAQGARPDVERLPHSGGLFPRPRRRHQYGPDHALPQRGPARGDLRDGAAGRSRGAAMRLRSRGAAPPQHDPARGAALSQPARPHLRQWPLSRGDGDDR